MTDAAFGHNRDSDGVDDLLDHLRVALQDKKEQGKVLEVMNRFQQKINAGMSRLLPYARLHQWHEYRRVHAPGP
jgi:hypothetical protein